MRQIVMIGLWLGAACLVWRVRCLGKSPRRREILIFDDFGEKRKSGNNNDTTLLFLKYLYIVSTLPRPTLIKWCTFAVCLSFVSMSLSIS